MAITPKLDLRQSQSLLMTPQLRQAINLLQLSNLELNELLEKELEANPFLEREDDRIESTEPEQLEQTIDNYNDNQEEKFEIDNTDSNDDFGSDREGYDDYSPLQSSSDKEFNYFEKRLSDKKSLYAFLDEQISVAFKDPKDRMIAIALAEQLDESGYFRGYCFETAKRLKTSLKKVQNILKTLKTFEPSGIFAENLAECLKIQLKDQNRLDPISEKLADNLELLAKRDLKNLKKICNCDDEDLSSAINDIKSLNPKPATDYAPDINSYIIPDVFVKVNKSKEYRIELNSQTLPKMLINRQYHSEIKSSAEKDKSAKRYLNEQISNATFLIKALHQRATTILRVSEEIVRTQRDFFEKGIDFLKPLQLKNIGEKIEMHESTVSRVTSNKYILTPMGAFELKYFFSGKAGTYTGDEDTSVLTIKSKIKKLIEEEKPDNILSDDKLVEEMAKLGFKIARRTVAKYRENMDLPTSAERKRKKRLDLS